ncbi:pyrroloquinoline quinone biosynthesis protein PqqB [Polyangium aurulentum]|uniref:pyrroloquinoline quinone biosynthesis protein PqqB n=1 Tax=Polyangium aurulentum TaxID=2567896 RepID=UPI0010AE7D3A|nr:pyrroloquinoline quinone biosynthesis protein PqqB [Polyangium aurulentum]UQA55821.1 pyrroloquinoline quinone biosynthesis protein PqqB [Polyangium aurulentum]
MLVRVLGSAAGGGFPQWNCACRNCRGVRDGSVRARPRSQAQVAVSADGVNFFLLGASPDVRTQIESFSPLHPRPPRRSPVAGVLLAHGDLEQTLGLLSLRESQPITVYATERVQKGFTEGNALYRALERFSGQVTWRAIAPLVEQPLLLSNGAPSGLSVLPVAVPGKVPLHLEERVPASPEDNVGFLIREPARGQTLAYFPSVGAPITSLPWHLSEANCIFFDGTFWSDDELVAPGLSEKRATDLAHWPVGGAEGSLNMLAGLTAARRILIHVNNTNPLLREDSLERRAAMAAGVEVAHDGMELVM